MTALKTDESAGMTIHLTINGLTKACSVAPGEMLLDLLRRLGYTSVKKGCDTGSCGVCTVLLDDRPVASCSLLAVKADGRCITTVEGVPETAEALGRLLTAEGAEQCGFCSPGLVLTVHALKKEKPRATRDEIQHYLSGNLCRCSGYEGQTRAITQFLEVAP